MMKRVIEARAMEEKKLKEQSDIESNKDRFTIFMFEKYFKDRNFESLLSNYKRYSEKHLHGELLNIENTYMK